jgi:hypothetical protein
MSANVYSTRRYTGAGSTVAITEESKQGLTSYPRSRSCIIDGEAVCHACKLGPITDANKGGLHMNNELNTYLGQEAPQWMKDMFCELSLMFEELFPDADRLNLGAMQRKLDEQQAHAEN